MLFHRKLSIIPAGSISIPPSPWPATLKFIHRRNGRDNRSKSPSPPPVSPNIPLIVNFQFRNYRHCYEASSILDQGNLSPPLPLAFTSPYEWVLIRDDHITRVYTRCGEEYKKKVTTSIMACIEKSAEGEGNGGVKILKRFSWINSRECTRVKSHRSFSRRPAPAGYFALNSQSMRFHRARVRKCISTFPLRRER